MWVDWTVLDGVRQTLKPNTQRGADADATQLSSLEELRRERGIRDRADLTFRLIIVTWDLRKRLNILRSVYYQEV